MQQDWKGLGGYGTVGLELVLSIVAGSYGGWWLDRKLGISPWLTLMGFGFGVAAGFRAVWRALERANREAEQQEQQEREARKKYHGRGESE